MAGFLLLPAVLVVAFLLRFNADASDSVSLIVALLLYAAALFGFHRKRLLRSYAAIGLFVFTPIALVAEFYLWTSGLH